jgi:hypothetical protein
MAGGSEPEKTPKGPTLTETVVGHPDEVAKLIDALETAIDHYQSNREKHYRSVANAQAKTASRIIIGTLLVVGAAVVATAYLAFRGTVSGDAFTFVVGTVVGSLIAFMAEHVAPNLTTVEEDEGG